MERRKGAHVSGWLVVDKPTGLGSRAVVNIAQRALHAQKVGHAGTLDPAATGVLALACGEATKTVALLMDALKTYVFTVQLGQATDTDDAEGRITARSAHRPSDAALQAALGSFVGSVMQVPPKWSAIKINGQRAYALARQGRQIRLAARPLWVKELRLLARPDPCRAVLQMTCGKGGYVRAVARDLGEQLGCYGHVRDLRRVSSGPFRVEDALPLDHLRAIPCPQEARRHMRPLEDGLAGVPSIPCSHEQARRLRQGVPVRLAAHAAAEGQPCWAACEGRAIAIGSCKGGLLHPTRVFAHPSHPSHTSGEQANSHPDQGAVL